MVEFQAAHFLTLPYLWGEYYWPALRPIELRPNASQAVVSEPQKSGSFNLTAFLTFHKIFTQDGISYRRDGTTAQEM